MSERPQLLDDSVLLRTDNGLGIEQVPGYRCGVASCALYRQPSYAKASEGILLRASLWQGLFCVARSTKQNGGGGVRRLWSHRVSRSVKVSMNKVLPSHSHVSSNVLKCHPIPQLWDEMGVTS